MLILFLISGLKLAELHSTAVDYVKTGVPAEWDKKLDPRRYPHFMEKAKNKTYHSTRVLGKLYDMVDKEVFDNKENYKLPFDDRILKRYELDNALLKEARKIKSQYDIAMRRVMGQLEIRTEFEVWTTFVLSRPRVGTDYKVQEKVGREGAGLKRQFRDLCTKVAEEQSFDRLEFVAAMYKVTWEETRIALYEARQPHVLPDGTVGLRRVSARSMPLISFPWIFPTELGRIAVGAEKLPNFSELWASSSTTTTKSKPRGVNRSDTDLDFTEMDYTKTSDGQFIHRGEILQLFRHDDDDGEEGFYCGDDAGTPDSPSSSVSQGESKGEQEARVSSQESTEGKNPGGFVNLLDLDTALDDISHGASTSATLRAPKAPGNAVQTAASPQMVRSIDILDLLSSNMDAGYSSSPCLTPIKVSAQHEHTTTEAAQPVGAGAEAYAATQSTAADSEAPTSMQSTSTETAAPAATLEEARSAPAPAAAAESVVSDSIHSWDRVTSADLDSSLELDPVEYITLPSTGAGFAGASLGASGLWGATTRPSLGEVDIWASPAGGAGGSAGERRADGNGGDDGSEGEVEYEEEIIEIVGETALERAARFG